MSVLDTDLKLKLSGGAANSDPNASLGGAVSSEDITDNTLNNLFDDVLGDEHLAGDINYRCVFIKNNSAETAYNVKVWIESNTTGEDSEIQIGEEAAGGSPVQEIADEDTAPSAISFSTADGQANALVLGDMAAGAVYAIWIKRIVSAGSTPQANDTAQLEVHCDTL
ncbi:MAG: hypothetical protein ABIC19_00625 [Patescibacteria group bacterium]|nr:hypothetical protein [Patescibacteria group bacterium]